MLVLHSQVDQLLNAKNDELKKFFQLLETFYDGSTSPKCTATDLRHAKDIDN